MSNFLACSFLTFSWVPSQKGRLLDDLHAQIRTDRDSSHVKRRGMHLSASGSFSSALSFLCEPSHHGFNIIYEIKEHAAFDISESQMTRSCTCFALLPHEHHEYDLPFSSSTRIGSNAAGSPTLLRPCINSTCWIRNSNVNNLKTNAKVTSKSPISLGNHALKVNLLDLE